VTFVEKLVAVRMEAELSQKDFAELLGFTPQYLCDLEKGRRLGSVEFVNRLCKTLRSTRLQREEWHLAGARSHGWEI
jgi:transcriptional regulator with XRE-family HTH domain